MPHGVLWSHLSSCLGQLGQRTATPLELSACKDMLIEWLSPRPAHMSSAHLPTTLRFSSVQKLIRVRLSATPRTAARQVSLSITNSRNLLKPMSIELVMPSSHPILCRPLLPPSIFLSFGMFSNESALHIKWPKNWSFSFNISPSNEYSGLISFRMHWLDLLAVQGTLNSLLQHHSSNHQFLGAQLSSLTCIHDHWKNHSCD